MRSTKAVAALGIVTLLLCTGCAKLIPGEPEPAQAMKDLVSQSVDDLSKRLPNKDFYGNDIEVTNDPETPYRKLCTEQEVKDPAGAKTIVRNMKGVAEGDLAKTLEDPQVNTLIIDETIFVLKDVKAAKDFVEELTAKAEKCPSSDSENTNETTNTYDYLPSEFSANGWNGYKLDVRWKLTPFDSGDPPYEAADINLFAQRGNVVVYASWWVANAKDVNASINELHKKIESYLSDLIPVT